MLLPIVFLLVACDVSTGDEGINSRTATLNESNSIVENPQNNQLSANQQRLLILINSARSQTQFCGEFGAMPAVQKLSWNFLLESSASNTVDDMASGDYFAHINPLTRENGAARISAVGYAYQRWGENLDAGYATPETAMSALLESDTHCRILMRPYWKEVAWFRRNTPEHGTYSVLGTQHFGREQ
jgi:uncharacterized protein YkwD